MNRESATNQAAWSRWVAGAALGAMAMYLSDPDKGRRRRALARDKMQSLMKKTGDALNVTSRDLGNRMQGLRAQANRMMKRGDDLSDDQLIVERVRSKMGRAVSHPHAIRVMANHGRITLSGPILANEKDQLLKAVRAVPGVNDIDDGLEVHDRPDVSSLQGEGKLRQSRPAFMQENWSPTLRAMATVGGGALGYYGLTRRSPSSIALAALGLGLMARGMMNMPLRRAAGIDVGKPPIHLQKTIYVDAQPEVVFRGWTNYENFPHFMSNVQKVVDLGNGRSHWVVNGPAGTVIEWDATLTDSRFGDALAWRSEPNAMVQHEGMVRFEPADGGTRVTVQMDYRPPAGMLGHAVASLFNGDPKKQMDEDLMRMKSFIESGIPPRDAAQPLRHDARTIH